MQTGETLAKGISRQDIISIVNCELAMGSIFLISCIAIVGLAIFYKNTKDKFKHHWALNMITVCFISMLLVFQQSYAVHIEGYSFIWAFLFALGLIVFFNDTLMSRDWKWKLTGTIIFLCCMNTLSYGSMTVTGRLLTT